MRIIHNYDDDIKLTDIISAAQLQKIQDAFSNATGMAALTVDLDGPVTALSNGTDFCMKLTRGSKVGMERCNKCDLQGGQESARSGRKAVYFCHGGLMDFAAPILIGGRQIGTLLGGQILPEPPDLNKFRRIAAEINVDPDEYVSAVERVKIVPKKQIEAAAELLYVMANALSQVGYQNLKSKQVSDDIYGTSKKLHDELESFGSIIQGLVDCSIKLKNDFTVLQEKTKKSQSDVEQTDIVAKSISTISTQTQLLGFNASIEAARAREYGSAFSVIAHEVRRLADTSNAQSVKITEVLNNVKKSILDMGEQSLSTNDCIYEIDSNISHLKSNLGLIREYLSELEAHY